MRRKLELSPAEMMELRNQGMSNHDIAKALEIDITTVYKYIGKQGGRMERMKAFADSKPEPKQEAAPEAHAVTYAPKVLSEMYEVGENTRATIYRSKRTITIHGGADKLTIDADEAAELVQFLVWASRQISREAPESTSEREEA